MLERLDNSALDTLTIVISDLVDELHESLKEYCATTFGGDEYLLLRADALYEDGAAAAADRIVSVTDEALQRGTLLRPTPMRVSLALYTELNQTSHKRIALLRDTVAAAGRQLGTLQPYACVLKVKMQGGQNARDLAQCVETCRNGAAPTQIPLLLVNRAIGVTIDLPLKSTVRYLQLAGRNSLIKRKLLGKMELVMSTAMLEYGEEDAAALQSQIDDLERALTEGSFTRRQMQETVRAKIGKAAQRLEDKSRIRIEQFPIRADAIGNPVSMLFCRKQLKAALRDTANTLARVYETNVHARCFTDREDGNEGTGTRTELLEKLPVSYVREHLGNDLDELEQQFSRAYAPYEPELAICLGETRLREQIREQYQKAVEHSETQIAHEVISGIRAEAKAYVESGELDRHEKEILERILRLKGKKRTAGNIKSETDFLQTLQPLLPAQGGTAFQSCTSRDALLLISREAEERWDQSRNQLPSAFGGEVFVDSALPGQTMQALEVTRFDYERYTQNSGLIFQTE